VATVQFTVAVAPPVVIIVSVRFGCAGAATRRVDLMSTSA